MSFPNYSPSRDTAPRKPAGSGRSRGDSAVSSLLGQAGQALGAVGSPSGSTGTTGTSRPARRGSLLGSQAQISPALPASSSSSTTFSFGHPHRSNHPHHSHHQHDSPISPPATSSTTDHLLRLPPVSHTGTGTGTGAGTGLGIGLNNPSTHYSGSGAAPAAAVPTGHSYQYYQAQHNLAGLSSPPCASSSSSSRAHASHSSNYHASSSAALGQPSPRRLSKPPDHRALAPPNVPVPGLRPSAGSGTATRSASGPAAALSSPPMFDLPSIPTSSDDFASIPYLNSNASPTSTPAATSIPKGAMSQQQQPQQQQQQQHQPPPQYAGPPRRSIGYGDDPQQQHHMQGSSQYQQHGQMSPRDYSTPSTGPHIKLDQAPSNPSSYQGSPAVPSVLQPGGPLARPPAVGANTASSLPTMQGSISQQQDYQTPAKPALNLSHSYSRSSPAAAYDGANPGFSPYTPTTPNAPGPSSSQFMSPTERGYNAPGSQRNISHTPLGLADIRPRADSSLSDGLPSGIDFAMQNTPPGTSNYMAPWATYAFDWCKWAPQGNGAGKVAIGSYLEDGHNFVSPLARALKTLPCDRRTADRSRSRFKFLIPKSPLPRPIFITTMAARSGPWTSLRSPKPRTPTP